ncbi:MAG: DnaJ domain-containing protein [Pirellulaceae bacterium]|nr:DnaJ domain-containing protein [Pirellulaceae bacterium]
MPNDDYYKVLNVPKTATQQEIQKAYRKLAKQYHPDLHEDKEHAKQKFQKVQQAYDVLGDAKKREMYDRFGPDFEQMRGPSGQPFEGQFHPGGAGGADFDFSQIFGNRGGRAGAGGMGFEEILRQFGGFPGAEGSQRRGPGPATPDSSLDVETEITIPFAVSVLGGEHRVAVDQADGPKSITVKIPAGIEDRKKIRLRNQGAIGPGNRRGDLLIRVIVAPHPLFRRTGIHLNLTLNISLLEAIWGTTVDVPTPYGTVALKIPPRSSSGRVLRLKGMGVPNEQGQKGDLLVELQIAVPKEIPTAVEGELKSALASIPTEDLRSQLKW